MPFLELSLHCREDELARFEQALEDAGALSVTMLDARAGTDEERAILEPGVGETPLWDALELLALFDAGADPLRLLEALEGGDPSLDWARVAFRRVDDQDWERAWMDRYVPLRFGARTWIVPWNMALPDDAQDADAAVVRLDPGLAFGSGTHPTTALCLRWLDTLAADGHLEGQAVLDFGSGSGVLALAALALGASSAVAVDNDPQALLATRDNASRNGFEGRLTVHAPAAVPDARYPVVVANILASALDTLAETLAASVSAGGRIALSGILVGQEPGLLARYAPWFASLSVTVDGDWVRIDGVRRLGADPAGEPGRMIE